MTPTALLWFQNDLRLNDQPAVTAALEWAQKHQGKIIPIYIFDGVADRQIKGASKWWLEKSLTHLSQKINKLTNNKGQLNFFEGNALKHIQTIIEQNNVKAVFWTRSYDQESVARDKQIKSKLEDQSILCKSFNGQLLFEPWEIKNKTGLPFKVYTPFWRECQKNLYIPDIQTIPNSIPFINITSKDKIQNLNINNYLSLWTEGLEKRFKPGEDHAIEKLNKFISNNLDDYYLNRDFPDLKKTSELSAHLRFGEITPHQILYYITQNHNLVKADKFISEIGWREFTHHVLYFNPEINQEPIYKKFKKFPWENNPEFFDAWTKGKTGIPIVDAGMRELWTTGYMHNRVRMITASFLVKNLMTDWRKGLEWFNYTLVDACPANNSFSWQWVAGCGLDAAPYFRIFNPIRQSEKFDKEGKYIQKWVPELQNTPQKYIHQPSLNPKFDEKYIKPIIDISSTREKALKAFQSL